MVESIVAQLEALAEYWRGEVKAAEDDPDGHRYDLKTMFGIVRGVEESIAAIKQLRGVKS